MSAKWAAEYVAKLQAGEKVSFRPQGRSMEPIIKSGALCFVHPVDARYAGTVVKGTVVLCEVSGRHYLHEVKRVGDGRFLIGNRRGRENGWIGPESIFGRLAEVQK